jgi:hypothetical protein
MDSEQEDSKTLNNLINPAFTFSFAGKDYEVKKANIEQSQQYYVKLQELAKIQDMPPASRDLEVVAYCIYLVLNKRYSEVTIDFVKENTPGTADVLQILITLGFIDPRRAEALKNLQSAG